MKRSQLNSIMRQAVQFAQEQHFALPPFAYWSPEDWKTKTTEYQEIIDHMLGWDITDFGSGDFEKTGLLMFTIRNGKFTDITNTKPYAEKLLLVQEGQVTPYHFHWKKTEDIINRGGGNLMVKLYEATEDQKLSDEPVWITSDGRRYQAPAGTVIRLKPGESVCLHHGQYHSFWGEPGTGMVLIGEVSCTNDDHVDNRFLEPVGRFPEIEEDEPPLYYLFSEIPPLRPAL